MDDLISRQAAIDALSRISNMNMCAKNYIMVKDMLKVIPSAQPERKMGKWVYLDTWSMFECSVCGRQMVRNVYNYCPWCGAEMVKGESQV